MIYKKDKKTYYFNSKFEKLNNLYQLTKKDKIEVDKNLKKQKSFLLHHVLSFNHTDETKTLLDLSYGANIRPDIYFAEMNNRVNSLVKYAKSINFNQPVFITLTPKSEHKPLKSISIGKNRYKMVDNPNFNGNPEHIREARDYLSKSWSNFTTHNVFRDIRKKYGDKYVYMKTYEPTLDGVPHLHALLFIPPEFKERVIKACSNSFKYSRHDIKVDFDSSAGGVIAYILKYILKSFKSAKEDKLDNIGYWYAKHKILRFTTSRSLLPLKIYRLIKGNKLCQDYLEMTKKYKDGYLYTEIQQKDYYDLSSVDDLKSKDFYIKSIKLIDVDYHTFEHNQVYFKSDDYEIEFYEKSKHTKMCYIAPPPSPIPIYLEDKNGLIEKIGISHHGNISLFKSSKSPHYMKDWQLYKYYHSLDLETVDLIHFGYVKNCMIERGLLDGVKCSLNDYNEILN